MDDTDQIRPADIVRFYLEAGVDTPLLDQAVNWLAEIKAKPEVAEPAKPAIIARTIVADFDASAAQTLDDLKSMIEAYDGCGLKKTATQVVFGDGVPGSRVMLIGEAPGRDEDHEGKPFAGKSGQMLDLILKAIGLDRTSVYIANAIYWRPPGSRPPTQEESAQCLPFIRRQIELAKPEVIVFVGGNSAKTMLGAQAGIMQLRGNWTSITLPAIGTLPALPTLHPDYLMRNPAHKRLAWADWLSLKLWLKNTKTNV